MVERGRRLAALATARLAVAVKVPGTGDGFRAARELKAEGAVITVTAVYSPGQVVAAAGFGAAYAAPYLGRLSDAGRDGPAAIIAMHEILIRTGSSTRLLTASIRSAGLVVDLARLGLDTFTFGPGVCEELLSETLTDKAAADFQRAAKLMGDDS